MAIALSLRLTALNLKPQIWQGLRKDGQLFQSERALDVTGQSPADRFADRFTFARSQQDGSAIHMHTRESTLTDFINGLVKILLALAVSGLVLIGCLFAYQQLDLAAEAGTAQPTPMALAQDNEVAQLRSEVALLTEQSLEIRSELALLTGQGGVLPKLAARLQEQRRVNGAYFNALRQLYSTTGLIGASLPALEENAAQETVGSRPVQVTPTARPADDTPKRVVLIPQGEDEGVSGAAKDGE